MYDILAVCGFYIVSHLRSFIGFGMSGMKFIELERIVTYQNLH